LPPAVSEPLAAGIGRTLMHTMPERRAMATRHVRRASGAGGASLDGKALDDAVAGTFDSYARYWLEMFRLPHVSRADLDEHFDIAGYEHVDAGFAAGKGVILALPHL